MVIESFPDAWLEDPDVNDDTKPLLDAVRERITWDAPIHSVADVLDPPWPPRMVNIKPSRFGPLSNLFEMYDWCEREGVGAYGGGQTELGPGRGHIQYLAVAVPPRHPERHGSLRLQPARTARRAASRARSSRASRRPASAGSSDRGASAPSGRATRWRWRAASPRSSARRASSLDLALYDVRLPGEPGDVVAARCARPPSAACACGSPTTPTIASASSRRRRGRSRSCSRRCRSRPAGSPASRT